MTVRIEIIADSVADAADKMLAWASVLIEGTKAIGNKTYPPTAISEIPPLEEPAAAEEQPKRKRGRPRKQPPVEAAPEPEAEEQSEIEPDPESWGEPDVSGDEEEQQTEEEQSPVEEADPFGVAQEEAPELTGEEAKTAAIAKLKDAFLVSANRSAITEIRMQFGVAQFKDVPEDRGHELLAATEDFLRHAHAA